MILWSMYTAELRFEELRNRMKDAEGYSVNVPSAVFNWALENGIVEDSEYDAARSWFGYQWDCTYIP